MADVLVRATQALEMAPGGRRSVARGGWKTADSDEFVALGRSAGLGLDDLWGPSPSCAFNAKNKRYQTSTGGGV